MSFNPYTLIPPDRSLTPSQYEADESPRRSKITRWMLVIMLLVLVALCGLFANGGWIVCMLTRCHDNPAGSPAPLGDMVAAADEAAQQAVPGAMLEGITAGPCAEWAKEWSVEKTLKVTFRYVAPNGQTLNVDMRDTDPHETANAWGPAIDTFMRSNDPKYAASGQEEYERLKTQAARRRETLSNVKLSPRQAEMLTWEEALVEARNDSTEIAPRIYFDFDTDSTDQDDAPTWSVHYNLVPPDRPPSRTIAALLAYSSVFTVDATTGEILGRDMDDELLSP